MSHAAYSNEGLTIVEYAAALTVLVQSFRFLLMKSSVLLPLTTVLLIYLSQVRL